MFFVQFCICNKWELLCCILFQTENEYLPEMKDFIGCKGSEPRYRGYPCSLWTLFHTLTVQAYITDEKTAGGNY